MKYSKVRYLIPSINLLFASIARFDIPPLFALPCLPRLEQERAARYQDRNDQRSDMNRRTFAQDQYIPPPSPEGPTLQHASQHDVSAFQTADDGRIRTYAAPQQYWTHGLAPAPAFGLPIGSSVIQQAQVQPHHNYMHQNPRQTYDPNPRILQSTSGSNAHIPSVLASSTRPQPTHPQFIAPAIQHRHPVHDDREPWTSHRSPSQAYNVSNTPHLPFSTSTPRNPTPLAIPLAIEPLSQKQNHVPLPAAQPSLVRGPVHPPRVNPSLVPSRVGPGVTFSPRITSPQSAPTTVASLTAPSTSADQQRHGATHSNNPLLLITLGEQYLAAAYRCSADAADSGASATIEQYHKLIATTVGCFESFLKTNRVADSALKARVSLRLARILLEETDNDAMIEEVLGKGIALCERHRLVDLRYSMQYLLVSLTNKTNPRAALKLVDRLLTDITTDNVVHWDFAFWFLKFSLYFQRGDLQQSLSAARYIAMAAEGLREPTVLSLASALEALVHLRIRSSGSPASAQLALAKARSTQPQGNAVVSHEISALVAILDLASDMDRAISPAKLKAMQQVVDHIDENSWAADGCFTVPLQCQVPDAHIDSGGILQNDTNGRCLLPFSWIRRSELYALAYLMSGVAGFQKNYMDRLTDKYLHDGIKLVSVPGKSLYQSLHHLFAYNDRRGASQCSLQLCAAIVACSRSKWAFAQYYLQTARHLIAHMDDGDKSEYRQFGLYLDAMIHHGQGDLDAALRLYTSPDLALTTTTGGRTQTGNDRDLRILAGLNSVLILGTRDEDKRQALAIMDRLRGVCEQHSNKVMGASFRLFQAFLNPESMTRAKAALSRAISRSKELNAHQLLAMGINLVDSRFMVGTVGNQSEAAGHAGVTVSRNMGNPLFEAAALQKWSQCLELHGKKDEAAVVMDEAESYMAKVVPSLKEKFAVVDGS